MKTIVPYEGLQPPLAKLGPPDHALNCACPQCQPVLAEEERIRLRKALEFCRDLAEEELSVSRAGTGAEVVMRHIARKCREALS